MTDPRQHPPVEASGLSRRQFLRRSLYAAGALAAAGYAAWYCRPAAAALPPIFKPRPLAGGTDVTFLAAADTHLGSEGLEAANEKQIDALNSIAGRPWPEAIGGLIAKPPAVIIAGDLTEDGTSGQWQSFVRLYGAKGADAKLKYPLWLGTGNHDRIDLLARPVVKAVTALHGDSLVWTRDLGDLHLICLDEYPDEEKRKWLAAELAAVGHERPVMIVMHYGLAGPFSDFWPAADKDDFARIIKGYNIIALVHGHWHASTHYRWHGFDAYCIGAVKNGQDTFLVVRVTETQLTVASWHWNRGDWLWWHEKPINAQAGKGQERSSDKIPDWVS
jgi:hypothetical protein